MRQGGQMTLKQNFSHVDELAQEVVNAWGINVTAGNGAYLTADFRVVFDKCCAYRDAKKTADNHRKFNMLSEREAAEEESARQAFWETYGAYSEKYSKRS
jgi:hypothetical protein